MNLWSHDDAEYISADTADDAIQEYLEDHDENPPETLTVVEWAPTEVDSQDAKRLAVRNADLAIERLLEDIEDGGEYCAEDSSVDPATVRSDLYQDLCNALEAIALWYPCSAYRRTGKKVTVTVAEWRKEHP